MQNTFYYLSPLGVVILTAEKKKLTKLSFAEEGSYELPKKLKKKKQKLDSLTPVLKDTVRWLDIYFSGREPDFTPKIYLSGTAFQMEVWDILKKIPYGTTVSYGEIARQIAKKRGIKQMSPQAVGAAVGHNPISIIVPCHRVIGWNGDMVGYGGGVERKRVLLELERE